MFVGMVGFLALTLLIPEMDDEEESQQVCFDCSFHVLSDKANDKESDKGSGKESKEESIKTSNTELDKGSGKESKEESIKTSNTELDKGSGKESKEESIKTSNTELDKGSGKESKEISQQETISQSSPSSQPLFQSSSQSHQQRSLRMTGLVTALGISLHNFPEGLVVFNATVVGVCKLPPPSSFSLAYLFQYLTQCTGRGLVVALAIAIHNIPEGIAVALPLYYSTHSKWEAMKWCLLSSICEPLAAILFGVFFHAFLTERLMAIMNAVVAGIMIILCVFELIPSALQFTSAKVGAR